MRISLALSLLLLSALPAIAQQNFSCNYGTRGACLGYGDKVVDQNSVCFSSFACGYRGFVCKSKLDDVVDEYDSLVMKHNELIRKHQELATAAQEILEKKRSIESDYEDLETKFKRLTFEHEQQTDELQTLRAQHTQLLQVVRSSSSRRDTPSKKSK